MLNNSTGSAHTYSEDTKAELEAVVGSVASRLIRHLLQPFVWDVNTVSGWGNRLKDQIMVVFYFNPDLA